ncbi:MAG: hypothetical protein ACYDBT_07560 [Desulfobulbaceae bacterium]
MAVLLGDEMKQRKSKGDRQDLTSLSMWWSLEILREKGGNLLITANIDNLGKYSKQ